MRWRVIFKLFQTNCHILQSVLAAMSELYSSVLEEDVRLNVVVVSC
jgi:hypothetical protein